MTTSKTVNQKMNEGRQYRQFMDLTVPTENKRIDTDYYVEGYATTFQPYVLYERKGKPIYEHFTREALERADSSDVIFQLNHEGKVYARNRNNTLVMWYDDHGFGIGADLGTTSSARQIHEEIKAGLLTKMSWGFLPDEWEFDKDTDTIVHKSIKKIFDVSVVSIPANNDTSISARSLFDGEIDKFEQELAQRALEKQRLLTLLKLGEILNEH